MDGGGSPISKPFSVSATGMPAGILNARRKTTSVLVFPRHDVLLRGSAMSLALTAIDGANPLGFLAALGTLVSAWK